MTILDEGRAMDVGRLVRDARLRLGFTQSDLARRTGLSVSTLRDLEQGRSRHPRARSVRALADALGLSPDQRERLYGGAARPSGAARGPARIAVLGPLTLSRSGVAVPLGGGRHRVVLARLALTPGHAVGTAELTQLLWGERPPATAGNVIQAYVSRLRTLLDVGAVTRTPGGYRLDADEDGLDLLAFRRRQWDWRQVAGTDPQCAFDGLHDALDLWRSDVAAADVPELHGDPLVTELSDELVAATVQLGRLGAAARRLPEVVPRLRRLASRHLWHEGLHARLIEALAASGQQAAALQAYDAIRRRLADELGIDPGGELLNAYGGVLDRRW